MGQESGKVQGTAQQGYVRSMIMTRGRDDQGSGRVQEPERVQEPGRVQGVE